MKRETEEKEHQGTHPPHPVYIYKRRESNINYLLFLSYSPSLCNFLLQFIFSLGKKKKKNQNNQNKKITILYISKYIHNG